jgi:ERCC4-type nuclease
LQSEYAAGEIDLDEFERRVELAMDSRACVIRDDIEQVDDIGPERSALIADRFDSLEDLRRADEKELIEIHGVGSSTAAKIQSHFE